MRSAITETDTILFKTFFPFAYDKVQEAKEKQLRFVHYTNAETAISIIKNKKIWMRNATCMNDFSEVQYGLNCLRNAYSSTIGEKFKHVLDGIFPNISHEIEQLFAGWVPQFQFETYLTCVSEHYSDEDFLGRLSMWRAYGKTSGIALVVKNEALLSTSDALKAYSNPVAYLDANGVAQQLNKISDNIILNRELISVVGREHIKQLCFNAFKFAILSIKHPGFKEEQEWRIIYTPSMDKSLYIEKDIYTVNGIPQQIYKIPLIDIPEEHYYASINNILDRIIIGPVEFPSVIYNTFIDTLRSAGINNPEKLIFLSDIPLRR